MDNIALFVNAPLQNIIATGILIIIAIILVPTMIIFLRKKSGITKMGPINFETIQKQGFEHFDLITTCQHYMDDEIQDIDDVLHEHCYDAVESIKLHITNILRPILVHGVLIENVTLILSLIFTASIIRNHFTKEFSQHDKYVQYRKRLLTKIKDQYTDLYERIKVSEYTVVGWDQIKDNFEEIIDYWLLNVKDFVKQACNDKIEIYERYKTRFNNDQHRIAICDECVNKNKKYIDAIDSLTS
jgi:hypothetical protein